ncbi:alpha/beta fold hydrolase [Azospirillum sp. sgz302134]
MTIHSSAEGHARDTLGIMTAGDGTGRSAGRDAGAGCALAGDPAGRRIVIVHANSSEARAWGRLLRSVPAGQEWVAVARPEPRDPRPDAGSSVSGSGLRPLLAVRRARKPLLVGCGTGVPVALRAALDFPELVGGLLLIDPTVAEPARPNVLRRIAARLLAPAIRSTAAELQAMGPTLGTIRVPVTLVQGKEEPAGFLGTPFLEQALTGCRTLTVVTVAGEHVLPTKHESAVRGALAALVASVERGGA